MKTDIQIARECQLEPIGNIAAQLGITPEEIEPYGRYMAKVPVSLIDEKRVKKSRLILVTAISPTKAGIGKTTVSIGLALGLNKIGKKAVVALREPSLGPCFGIKGGAAGGGYAQVLPMDKINLHFTGDFHAVTSAHNTISALLDNYIYQHRKEGFSLREIYWKRVLDVNDRALRNVVTGLRGDGVVSETGFDITSASELMAILCLATSEKDLQHRIENILLGITSDGKPFRVRDLGVAGAITVLLRDALSPNLVVGWMDSANPMIISEKNGVAYDPSCVQHMVRISEGNLSKGLVFGVLDVAKREIIWLEMPFTSQTLRGADATSIEALLHKLEAKLSVGQLLDLKAKAQNLMPVEKAEDADEAYTYEWALNPAEVTTLLNM